MRRKCTAVVRGYLRWPVRTPLPDGEERLDICASVAVYLPGKPSAVAEQLAWLGEAGLRGRVAWARRDLAVLVSER